MDVKNDDEKKALFSEDDREEEDMLVSQLNMEAGNQYVVFSVGEQDYGIPILSVQEIISMPGFTRVPGVPEYIPGIINLRGNIIPVYMLKDRFGKDETARTENQVVIIVSAASNGAGRTAGIIVDSVSDVVSLTEEFISETPDFSGAADVRFVERIGRLGGRMIMILDLVQFLSERESSVADGNTQKAAVG